MHVRERMIRERIATVRCESCGRTYGLGTVLILARRPAAWLVLASCGHCNRRCIYLVSFRDARLDVDSASVEGKTSRLSLRRAYALTDHSPNGSAADPPITDDDVGAMRNFLAGFTGDFQRLFATDGPPTT